MRVLPSSAVLLFSPKVDLTDEVIKRLDDKLPSVKVPDKLPQQPGLLLRPSQYVSGVELAHRSSPNSACSK